MWTFKRKISGGRRGRLKRRLNTMTTDARIVMVTRGQGEVN